MPLLLAKLHSSHTHTTVQLFTKCSFSLTSKIGPRQRPSMTCGKMCFLSDTQVREIILQILKELKKISCWCLCKWSLCQPNCLYFHMIYEMWFINHTECLLISSLISLFLLRAVLLLVLSSCRYLTLQNYMFDSRKQYHALYDHSLLSLGELQLLWCLYSHLPLVLKFGYLFLIFKISQNEN